MTKEQKSRRFNSGVVLTAPYTGTKRREVISMNVKATNKPICRSFKGKRL